eukprot:5602257-Pyramimonas_sp.AAC.1
MIGMWVDTRAPNDPTHARHIGHRPDILRNAVGNEHYVGIVEYAGRSLSKSTSSQFVCIVAIGLAGLHRSVAVSYGVQFLRQYDIECSSARLSRHEWPEPCCNGECDDCCHLSNWA